MSVGRSLLAAAVAVAAVLGWFAPALVPEGTPEGSLSSPPTAPVLQRLLYHPVGLDDVRSRFGAAATPFTAIAREPFQATFRGDVALDWPDAELVYDVYACPGASAPASDEGAFPSVEGPTLSWTPPRPGSYRMRVELTEGGDVTELSWPVTVTCAAHALGTDNGGRDVLRRIVRSFRPAVAAGALAIVIAVTLGGALGALAGYAGGDVARRVGAFSTFVHSVPGLLVLFLAALASNLDFLVTMAAVGLVIMPEAIEAVRQTVEAFRLNQFVEAGRELGLSHREILFREILWYNARPVVRALAARAFGFAVLMEVTLSYLGLSVAAGGTSSWGNLLAEGKLRAPLGEYWMVASAACAVIAVVATTSWVAGRERRRGEA